jgi:hypothetical protein
MVWYGQNFLLLVRRFSLRMWICMWDCTTQLDETRLFTFADTVSRWMFTTLLLSLRLAVTLARVQQLALALATLDFALIPLAIALGTVAHKPAM